MRAIHTVERRAEVGVFLADHDDRVFPVAADHVDVEVRDNLRHRDDGVLAEPGAAPEPMFLAAHREEYDRTLRPRVGHAQRFRELDHAGRA